MAETSREDALAAYAGVDWSALGRGGLLAPGHVEALRSGEAAPLDYVLGDATAARAFCGALVATVAGVADVAARRYALTRVEDVLLADASGPLVDRVALFCAAGSPFDGAPFLRALRETADAYCVRCAASVLATLLTVRDEAPVEPFVQWLCERLAGSEDVRAAVPALTILLRVQRARTAFAAHGGVGLAAALLRRGGGGGGGGGDASSAQLAYEVGFCLWTLSFADDAADGFLRCAAVDALCDLVAAAPREKVARVGLAALRNLAERSPAAGEAMVARGLAKALATLAARPWADPDVPADVDALKALVAAQSRELSTLERYAAELDSGRLAWGPVHAEKFWREHARAAEHDDFALVKRLVALLEESGDATVLAVACYDVGEFARFYPNGKTVLKHLGAKARVMALIDHADPDVQRHALQCVSKILLKNFAVAAN